MIHKNIPLLIILLFFTASSHVYAELVPLIEKEKIAEDIMQLAQTIESAHPDPYSHSGGRIKFHRRLHHLIKGIPEKGMSFEALQRYLMPFIAAIGDCHTSLLFKSSKEQGLPVLFDVVGEALVVKGVLRKSDSSLFGAKLSAINSIPVEDLIKRQKKIWGWKTSQDNMNHFRKFLAKKTRLKLLIPEWGTKDLLEVAFVLSSGTQKAVTFKIDKVQPLKWIYPITQLPELNTGKKDFATGFFDTQKQTAWIKMDRMMVHREYFEAAMKERDDLTPYLYACYERFNGTIPENTNDALAGIPSAVEIFRKLVVDMRKAGTQNLIIDISQNKGGDSLMGAILVYYLFGKDKVLSLNKNAYEITRYSDLYFKNIGNFTQWERAVKDRQKKTIKTSYDFTEEDTYQSGTINEKGSLEKVKVAASETFKKEWDQGAYSAFYRPEKIFVISSAETYFTGFELLVTLSRNGAVVVGSHPGQAGNHYESKLNFKLKHSRIPCGVSSKFCVMFPDDPEKGKLFEPDHLITYERMVAYQFDPNARTLYALELLKNGKNLN